MRFKFWRTGEDEPGGRNMEGPPWIDLLGIDGVVYAEISLDGTEDHARALVDKEEWEILKKRVDAAFASEDPNREEFYSGEPKSSSRS